jgi:hypothetical protein
MSLSELSTALNLVQQNYKMSQIKETSIFIKLTYVFEF